MYCNTNKLKDICSCQSNYFNNPALWSKKRKITLLEEYLENLEKQIIPIYALEI